MSADMLKYCNKVTIEEGEKTIDLNRAVEEFFTYPNNIARLRSYINYYCSFDEINIYFNEDLNCYGVKYGSCVQFPSTEDEETGSPPSSLTVRFTKYAHHVIDNEYYLYDVCFTDDGKVTVQKNEKFKLVSKYSF